MATQLFAKIKRSSKYADQADFAKRNGQYPFPVEISADENDYVVQGGPGGQYRLSDIILYAGINGKLVKIKG